MRNTEAVTIAAISGKELKRSALSTVRQGEIYSYRTVVARQTGPQTWEVEKAGTYSTTTSKHCSGIANELARRGFLVTRV